MGRPLTLQDVDCTNITRTLSHSTVPHQLPNGYPASPMLQGANLWPLTMTLASQHRNCLDSPGRCSLGMGAQRWLQRQLVPCHKGQSRAHFRVHCPSLRLAEFKDRALVLMGSSFPVTSFCSGHWGSTYLARFEDAGTLLGSALPSKDSCHLSCPGRHPRRAVKTLALLLCV